MNTTDPALPSYVRSEVYAYRDDLDLVSDLLAGTRRMWNQSWTKKYIRKWADEDQKVYEIRRQCETVFEGLGRVLSACVGMLFARVPQMEWNASESAMTGHYANLDAMGTAGPVLCKRFADKALAHGIACILVDHTPAPGIPVTGGNERTLGLRPTWAIYERQQVLSWRTEVVYNAETLVQVVLEECRSVNDGKYGTKPVKRYRVLSLGVGESGERVARWELWEETKEGGMGGFKRVGGDVFMNSVGETRSTLPFRVAYAGRTDAPMCATVPLLGVAYANLAHWRLSTALTFAREIACYAQGVVVGDLAKVPGPNGTSLPGRVKLGPLALVQLVGEGASFEWKAPPVDAFAPMERGIKEKLEQIGQMGMAFLVSETRAAETAEAKRLDATAENSTLATAGQAVEDAWNGALEDHAWYLGIERAGAPVVTINKDFDSVALDAQTMVAYVTAVRDAGLPPRLLLQAWQAGGRIPVDTDLDELEAEMMANAAAAEAQKAAELAAQVQPLQRTA